MGTDSCKRLAPAFVAAPVLLLFGCSAVALKGEEPKRELTATERHGGRLVTAQRAEPKTFNPAAALDTPSREVIGLMTADLIHINRRSLKTEPALAESWNVSPDGHRYTIRLRRGVRFSDGHPMDADDVVFTFHVHLDERVGSSQRSLLIVAGKPITVVKLDSHTIRFDLAAPYAAAERLFDGIAILPRHRLLQAYEQGSLAHFWGLNTPPDEIAGLGPFRLKQYVPGERVVLQRNPYYWKSDQEGRRLPYLDEVVFLFIPSDDAQAIRFQTGEINLISSLNSENFVALKARQQSGRFRLYNAGPGFEFSFLVFNLKNAEPEAGSDTKIKRSWFRQLPFRQAVSAAMDREAMVRLAYRGLAEPIGTHVTRGNSLWANQNILPPERSIAAARQLLKNASFSWKDGALVDPEGRPVEFSLMVSAGNSHRMQMATIIHDDLRQLGMKVTIVSLEFRTMLDRILNKQDYEAAVMTLASGDADPTSDMNIWLSEGGLHVWNLSSKSIAGWEQEIDRLMRQQMITSRYPERKRLYDRVQQLVSENLPLIYLTSPHVLVGATAELANLQPAVLRPYALWNSEFLYFRKPTARNE